MDKRYTSVEEQVEYSLDSIDEGRRIEVSARDLVYAYNTIWEMIGFFHNPDHYPNIAAVQKFIGSKDAGALHLVAECCYRKLEVMLPADIHQENDGGVLDNPASPYYYQPWDEQGSDKIQDLGPLALSTA